MADFIKKAKEFFDWMEHGRLVVDILVGLGAGTVVRGALVVLTHLNSVWVTPLWLFVAAGVTFAMSRIKFSRKTGQPPSTVQTSAPGILPASPQPVNFDAVTFFRQAYTSALTGEAEKNFRLAAQQNQPNDREGFLLKIMGIGLVAWVHDLTWSSIFKSQLLMLLELNKRNGLLPLVDAKTYYDQAAIDFPRTYANYTFDQWIAYLKGETLIIHHASNMLEITLKGKDLLKYLTHWGRYPEARRN